MKTENNAAEAKKENKETEYKTMLSICSGSARVDWEKAWTSYPGTAKFNNNKAFNNNI